MENESSLFVVDGDSHTRAAVVTEARARGTPVKEYASARDFLADLDPAECGCLVVGMQLDDISGLELQQMLREEGISIPTIFIGKEGEKGVENAVQAMRNGAITFLAQPLSYYDLWLHVDKALASNSVPPPPESSQANSTASTR